VQLGKLTGYHYIIPAWTPERYVSRPRRGAKRDGRRDLARCLQALSLMMLSTAGSLYPPVALGDAADTGLRQDGAVALIMQINTNLFIVATAVRRHDGGRDGAGPGRRLG
ncbi:MAG: hypothetical protein ACOC05_02950, partial [Oceanicaulis sp.]